jgi:hypothetical protein
MGRLEALVAVATSEDKAAASIRWSKIASTSTFVSDDVHDFLTRPILTRILTTRRIAIPFDDKQMIHLSKRHLGIWGIFDLIFWRALGRIMSIFYRQRWAISDVRSFFHEVIAGGSVTNALDVDGDLGSPRSDDGLSSPQFRRHST